MIVTPFAQVSGKAMSCTVGSVRPLIEMNLVETARV